MFSVCRSSAPSPPFPFLDLNSSYRYADTFWGFGSTVLNSRNLPYYIFFLANPPSPLSADVIYAPKKKVILSIPLLDKVDNKIIYPLLSRRKALVQLQVDQGESQENVFM